MRNYELMFVVRPTLEEASIKKVFEETKKMLTDNNAKVLEEQEMGQRELAYEIKKHKNLYNKTHNKTHNNVLTKKLIK